MDAICRHLARSAQMAAGARGMHSLLHPISACSITAAAEPPPAREGAFLLQLTTVATVPGSLLRACPCPPPKR